MSKSEWSLVPIGSVCDGIFDGPHATPPKSKAGPVFLGIGNLVNGRVDLTGTEHVDEVYFEKWTRRVVPRAGDLVFSYETRLGEGATIPDGLRCCLGRRMALARPNVGRVNPRFLLYSFLSPEFQDTIRRHTVHGSTVDRLPLLEFPNLGIRLPERMEQDAIAAVLGALDDKIEQNQRTGRALERLARATFKAWFVDFEPVKAKAAGAAGFPGMPAAAFAALPDLLTDSRVGPVPQGWQVRPIGDVVSIRGGGTPSTKVAEYWEEGAHFWATPKDLSGLQSPVLLRTERRITDAGAKCISSGVMPENTVLLSSRAPVGYTAISKVPIAVNQGFIAMVCDGPLPPHYVLHWTRSALEEIKSRASGTTFPEISKGAFRPIPAVVPTPAIVKRFERIVQSLFDLIQASALQSNQLGELRDYLLPRLLSGSVRVRV